MHFCATYNKDIRSTSIVFKYKEVVHVSIDMKWSSNIQNPSILATKLIV